VPGDKAARVRDFHRNTLRALSQMLAAAGLSSPGALRPHHLQRRLSVNSVQPFSRLHDFLEPGELLRVGHRVAEPYASAWAQSSADSFAPQPAEAPGDALLAELALRTR
jgi:hypothetical protein